MFLITSLFLGCIAIIMGCIGRDWLEANVCSPGNDCVLRETDMQYGIGGGLLFLGVMSVISCFFHWKLSIEPLYSIEEEEENPEEIQMQQNYV